MRSAEAMRASLPRRSDATLIARETRRGKRRRRRSRASRARGGEGEGSDGSAREGGAAQTTIDGVRRCRGRLPSERLSRDMRRRETELRATLAPATRRSDFRFDDAPREREEADRRYLRSVIRERLVREGVYRPAENEGGLPRDDAGLVAVVRQHAASLGVVGRGAARRGARKKKAPRTETRTETRPPRRRWRRDRARRRRRNVVARRERRAIVAWRARLRRADFMRRYEADVERRGLSTAAARARGVTGSNPGSGASPARARVRRRAMSEFGDGDGAAMTRRPPSVRRRRRSKFSRYRRRLEEADEAIEAMAELKRKGGREDARPVTADAPVGILKKTGATARTRRTGGRGVGRRRLIAESLPSEATVRGNGGTNTNANRLDLGCLLVTRARRASEE